MKRLLALASVALACTACEGSFRRACTAIAPGELVVDVGERLTSEGSRYEGGRHRCKPGQAYSWTRRAGFFKVAYCLVFDDQPPSEGAPDANEPPPPHARVTSVEYVEGDDLL